VNVTVPFLLATVVYVNVNVLLVAVHHVVAALNVKSPFVVIVISLPARAVVATHTPSVHVNVIVHDSHAFTYFLVGSHQLHSGAVTSTFTLLLALVTAFVFHAASATFHAANLNVVVPFHFAVYVNVYTFPFVVFVTVAALKSTTHVEYVIALAAKLVVLIALHVEIHVNATVPVCHTPINVFVGCVLIVQLGAILSTVTALLALVATFLFHALSTT